MALKKVDGEYNYNHINLMCCKQSCIYFELKEFALLSNNYDTVVSSEGFLMLFSFSFSSLTGKGQEEGIS